MSETNAKEWFETPVSITIDRRALLNIVIALEMALHYGNLPPITAKEMRLQGASFLIALQDQGLTLPGGVLRSYREAFKME